MYWWSWPLIVVHCVVSQTAITVVCEIIIKILHGLVDDLRGRNGLYALPTRGIMSVGSSASWCRPRTLWTSAVPRPAPGSGVVLFAREVWLGFDYASPASHAPCRSTFGLGSKARRT